MARDPARLSRCVAFGSNGPNGAYGLCGLYGAYGLCGLYGAYSFYGPNGPIGSSGAERSRHRA